MVLTIIFVGMVCVVLTYFDLQNHPILQTIFFVSFTPPGIRPHQSEMARAFEQVVPHHWRRVRSKPRCQPGTAIVAEEMPHGFPFRCHSKVHGTTSRCNNLECSRDGDSPEVGWRYAFTEGKKS